MVGRKIPILYASTRKRIKDWNFSSNHGWKQTLGFPPCCYFLVKFIDRRQQRRIVMLLAIQAIQAIQANQGLHRLRNLWGSLSRLPIRTAWFSVASSRMAARQQALPRTAAVPSREPSWPRQRGLTRAAPIRTGQARRLRYNIFRTTIRRFLVFCARFLLHECFNLLMPSELIKYTNKGCRGAVHS